MNPLPARLWGKLLEPKTQVEPSRQPFSNQDLKQLIIPLFVEQMLAMLVGIADTLMVSYAGEAAVSGVSLVNMLNTFFIFLFTALASGGAVVVSQYIGSRDGANSNLAAGQLYTLAFLFSLVCMAATLVWNRPLLGLLFGQVEPDVMEASAIYLRISAYSYPFLALYNAGAALYRCMSKTKVTMQISLVMNAINVAGNAIGIFVLHAGVAGVAWPSTISRAFAAVAMTALCFSQKNQVRLLWKDLLTWNSSMVRRLLRIAVPNSIENGLFQLAKVALSSITAMFGTVQIAANAVANNLDGLGVLAGAAMNLAILTVVGRCVGAHDNDQVRYYTRKLLKIEYAMMVVVNVVLLAALPLILNLYTLSPASRELATQLIFIHDGFAMLLWPLALSMPNALRAANDVKFTMVLSIGSMVCFRIALSYVVGVRMGYGALGVWFAMLVDWAVRAAVYMWRFEKGKWESMARI